MVRGYESTSRMRNGECGMAPIRIAQVRRPIAWGTLLPALNCGFRPWTMEAASRPYRRRIVMIHSTASLSVIPGSGFGNLLFEAAISRQQSAVRHSIAERLLDFEFRIADFEFESELVCATYNVSSSPVHLSSVSPVPPPPTGHCSKSSTSLRAYSSCGQRRSGMPIHHD